VPEAELLTSALIFIAALLYSSVGHGGASGYLAVMALMSVAPAQMKPAALALNVLVASMATWKFYKASAFSWPLLWPLCLASIPMAFIGGTLSLPGHIYKPIIGVVLVYAALKSFWTAKAASSMEARPVSTPVLLGLGASLGLLSGLTGVGGGIFISPILIFLRWADVKTVSGVAAAFILANSVSGLAGVVSKGFAMPPGLLWWAVAAGLGGYIGSEFGSKRLGNPMIQRILALVLLIAGGKMLMSVGG
jgi:uncharacterized membrane protein YfcA